MEDRLIIAVRLNFDDPLDRLRGLRAADQQLHVWRHEVVTAARQHGVSWSTIGEALGVSKQAAWEFYNAGIRAKLDRATQASDLSETEAMQLAKHELAEVRRQRRASGKP